MSFRPLSGSYISQYYYDYQKAKAEIGFRPLSGSYISQFLYQYELPQLSGFPSPIGELHFSIRLCERRNEREKIIVSVPYRGATFLNSGVSVPYRGATFLNVINILYSIFHLSFRPLSGSYISQYHPRNPMSCLGRIGGLRGKSNFIEIQPFWKVKSSHKSSI